MLADRPRPLTASKLLVRVIFDVKHVIGVSWDVAAVSLGIMNSYDYPLLHCGSLWRCLGWLSQQ